MLVFVGGGETESTEADLFLPKLSSFFTSFFFFFLPAKSGGGKERKQEGERTAFALRSARFVYLAFEHKFSPFPNFMPFFCITVGAAVLHTHAANK